MQCIACLFGLAFIAVVYGVFLILWAPAGHIFKVKNKTIWYLSSVPVFIVLVVLLYLYLNRPAAVYERVLGFPPTSDVTILNSDDFYFADTGKTYLRFTANESTINKIAKRGLYSGGYCNALNDVPGWWKPNRSASILYTGSFSDNEIVKEDEHLRQQNFASEIECLYYNATTKEAYYVFIGID